MLYDGIKTRIRKLNHYSLKAGYSDKSLQIIRKDFLNSKRTLNK